MDWNEFDEVLLYLKFQQKFKILRKSEMNFKLNMLFYGMCTCWCGDEEIIIMDEMLTYRFHGNSEHWLLFKKKMER